MIVSWNWLNRYVDLSDLDAEQVARKFTITTAEIEEVILPPKEDFLNQFEVALVEEVKPHPNADKLRCCKVKSSSGVLDIVCGAPNVREGLKVILAPVGTKFGDFTIKKAKLRGEPSHGMLCSEKELEVGNNNSGLMELDDRFEIGTKAGNIFTNLPILWDLDNKAITHRPDLWGHYGIARELAAIYQRDLKPLKNISIEGSGSDGFSVEIQDADLSRRYCGLSIKNVKAVPSPQWMQSLLKEIGLSPINNLVDATNFVMHEIGQPCHAFDQALLPSKDIKVAHAKKDEAFTTLLDKELKLSENNLVIRSGEQAVALAGVIGGQNSSIQDNTSDIFLEAAHFEALSVRKTAHQHDVRTDSSARFEKSLDPENAALAIARLATCIQETCPDMALSSELIDVYPNPIETLTIELSPEVVNKKMGVEISVSDQQGILERLGFKVESANNAFKVTVPSYRNTKDIEAAIDLVEEIGRIYGYDKIIPQSPSVELEPIPDVKEQKMLEVLQDTLVYKGYNEIVTYSFTNEKELAELGLDSGSAVKLKNPVNKEQTHMRTTILSRALEVCSLNAKNLDQFKLFECGKVFEKTGEQLPNEKDELICLSYGASAKGEGFYELKSDMLNLLEHLGVYNVKLVVDDSLPAYLHPVRSAKLVYQNETVAFIGELNPAMAKSYQLKERLNLCIICNPLGLDQHLKQKFKPIQKYPVATFALSLIVDQRTYTKDVLELVQSVDETTIQEVKWVENFQGDAIPEGKLSMTISMKFVNPDRTLSGDEIDALQDKIVAKANEAGYFLRAK